MCSGIKRYDFFATFEPFDNYCQIEAVHEVDGEWVKYDDHKKIVDELQGKLNENQINTKPE